MSLKIKTDAAPAPSVDPKASVEEKIAANLAAAAKNANDFAASNTSIKLPANYVPKRVQADSLPTKRYHIGCIPGSPFESMYVGHQDFPLFSTDRVQGIKGTPVQTIPKIGKIVEWTDEQLEWVLRMAAMTAWRTHSRQPDRSSRWESVRLADPGKVYQPGDKLTAHYIYIDPLPPGKDVSPGIHDAKGNFLPTPEPLMVD